VPLAGGGAAAHAWGPRPCTPKVRGVGSSVQLVAPSLNIKAQHPSSPTSLVRAGGFRVLTVGAAPAAGDTRAQRSSDAAVTAAQRRPQRVGSVISEWLRLSLCIGWA
jgi:hypothetical protein